MTLSIEQIATAFSRHQFEEAAPHLRNDVTWNNLGGDQFNGKDAVVAACRQSADYLANVTTTFARFIVRIAGDTVIIESTATYAEPGGDSSIVASCDIYDFVANELAVITSYTIELAAPA